MQNRAQSTHLNNQSYHMNVTVAPSFSIVCASSTGLTRESHPIVEKFVNRMLEEAKITGEIVLTKEFAYNPPSNISVGIGLRELMSRTALQIQIVYEKGQGFIYSIRKNNSSDMSLRHRLKESGLFPRDFFVMSEHVQPRAETTPIASSVVVSRPTPTKSRVPKEPHMCVRRTKSARPRASGIRGHFLITAEIIRFTRQAKAMLNEIEADEKALNAKHLKFIAFMKTSPL